MGDVFIAQVEEGKDALGSKIWIMMELQGGLLSWCEQL